MSSATAGRAREHRVRNHLIVHHDWQLIARSAGSKGAADLVMAHPEHGLALIQVGTPNKTLGPDDRARLIHAANLASALPLLAVVTPGVGIKFWHVTAGPASTWTEFTP